jgi:HAD superfamily hydrolase (TIGR01549 family)
MPLLDDFDLFIFDWDGTISSSTFIVRATRFFKRRYDINYIERHKASYRVDDISNIKIEEEEHMLFSRAYDLYSVFVKPRLKPGAKEVLDALKKNGKKTAVFSDAIRYRLIKEARMLGLSELPDTFLSSDSIKRYKPDPTGLLIIADKFKAKKDRTLYVGDMSSDIMTARFAGVHVAAVADGVQTYSVLKAARPDHIFRTMSELAQALR